MKKFLLFCFVTLFNLVSAHAQSGEIVAYSTEIDGTTSKQELTIEKSNFVGLRGGDYFKVTISNATTTKLSMKDAKNWDSFVYEQAPSDGVYTTVILTEKQASDITENGLYIVLEGAKITKISFCHSDAVPFWNGSKSFDWSFDISDNLKAFQGATTNDRIRFKGVLEGTGQHQLYSFQYLTGDGWDATDISTGSQDFYGNAGDEFVCYVDVTSSLISAINATSDATKIRAYRINGKGIILKEVELCTPLSLSESQNLACDAGDYITVNLTRTLKAGWNTICLPFDVADVSTAFGANYAAYAFTAKEGDDLTFSPTVAMTANTPYLIFNSGSQESDFSFTDVTISSTSPGNTATYGSIAFYGNYTAGMSMNGKLGLVNGGSGIDQSSIKKGTSDAHLKAFGAYFNGTIGSRGFLGIETNDGTTGIKPVNRIEQGDGIMYGLDGKRLTTPKGLYIMNGKKYFAK